METARKRKIRNIQDILKDREPDYRIFWIDTNGNHVKTGERLTPEEIDYIIKHPRNHGLVLSFYSSDPKTGAVTSRPWYEHYNLEYINGVGYRYKQ